MRMLTEQRECLAETARIIICCFLAKMSSAVFVDLYQVVPRRAAESKLRCALLAARR